MGKQTVSVASGDSGSDNENADVEYEEVSEEEEPSEEEPIEEVQEVDSCEEPNNDSCRGNEEKLCTQQLDGVDSCEVDPNEEDSFEGEPNEDISLEEEPDEVNSCGTPSEDACTGEQNEESCEEEPYEDDEQCEEEMIDEDSCEEVPDIEEPEEPCEQEPVEEPCEQEPVEEEPEEDEPEEEEPVEEEPSEDPEEEPCEGSPVSSSFNRNNENITQSNFRNLNMSSGPKRISDLSGIRNPSNNVIVQEKQATTGSTGKKRHSKWDIKDEANKLPEVDGIARKKRKTRWSSWSDDNSQFSMGTALKSPGIEIDLEIPKLHAQLLEIGKKLRSGVVDDRPLSERSPSPPPIYNNLGLKINTREARLRSKLMTLRQTIISELIRKSRNFKPPPDYKRYRLYKRLYIPSKKYPGYNFVGIILGPCGNTQKRMEEETGAKICLRGKGSVLGGKPRQNKPDPSDKKDLHVLIEADDRYSLDAAVAMVKKLLIPVADGHNIHKLSQLRELAELKGTLTGTDTSNSRSSDPCDICGASHPTSVCPLSASASGANSIDHQVNFFAEMGSVLPSSSVPPLPAPIMPPVANSALQVSKPNKEIDDAKLFVGDLQAMDDNNLMELFSPFGSLCEAKVIRDQKTGLSKGYGFVKYTDSISAAKALAHMNGYNIDGKSLVVQIAGANSLGHQVNFAEMGGGLSSFSVPPLPVPTMPPVANLALQVSKPKKEIDDVKLFVCNLQSMDDNKLIELFSPFGSLYEVKVIKDRKTGLSKGYGFVNYSDSISAAKALAHMNGYNIDGNMLTVRIAGVPPVRSDRRSERSLGQLPIYPGPAAIAQSNPDPMHWPGPPESRLPETVSTFSNSSSSFSNSSTLPIHNTPFSGQYSMSRGPSYQTPLTTSHFSGDLAVSSELAQFPGYLKSLNSPAESYYQSTLSTSLSSSQARFTQNFGTYQMPPT